MKLEKLTENKVRVVLNFDELSQKNIDIFSLTKNTNETHKIFKKLLKRAEKELNFHVDDSKLLIEAFISTEGFFIITFTKLDSFHDTPIGIPVKLKIRKKDTLQISNCRVYEFSNIYDFVDFCTYFKNTSFNCSLITDFQNALYKYNEKLYLILFNFDKLSKEDIISNSEILEFAKYITNSIIFCSKIIECGNPVFKTL